MLKHGLSTERLFELEPGQYDEGLADTVHDIASQAFAHLEKGR
jgi:hypothetical protein